MNLENTRMAESNTDYLMNILIEFKRRYFPKKVVVDASGNETESDVPEEEINNAIMEFKSGVKNIQGTYYPIKVAHSPNPYKSHMGIVIDYMSNNVKSTMCLTDDQILEFGEYTETGKLYMREVIQNLEN